MGDRLNILHYQQQQQQQQHQQKRQQQEYLHSHYQQRQISSVPVTRHEPILSNLNSSMKRGRACSEESSAAASFASSSCDRAAQQGMVDYESSQSISSPQASFSATPKKARSTNYEVPRSVKPSILTAMGTLAGGDSVTGIQDYLSSNSSVPMRRRLSGGHIDQYIGEHNNNTDGMDIDTNRPRSMSF